MKNKKIILKFRAVNRDTFEAIARGDKKIETRAVTERYRAIKAGDTLVLICGKKRLEKKVKKVELFKSIGAILKNYKPVEINPKICTNSEARDMWYGFPGYKEKIRKYGLMAILLS